MSNLSIKTQGLVKTIAVSTAVATVVSLASFALLASAAKPSDYGLKEGDTVSAAGSSDPDVYIVNDWGYKRLFLSPQIFKLYGHLGGFANVHNVSAATRDAFPTSGLFRVDGDQKVYGLETTGEDVAVLHWVNTSGSQAVADDPNFFKKVFVINAAEKALYGSASDYTSVSQVPAYARGGSVPGATPAPASGPVSVSLASDNPGAASVTKSANGVTFMKLALSGNGTVNSMRVVRKGPGATADFSNVYIYDGARRLTSGRTPSSSDGSITFSGLNIAVNGSKMLAVVADLSSATAGNVDYFSVEKAADVVLSGGAVTGGSFPLNGSNMTVTGQAGGTLTIDKSGSLSNPNVGQSNAELAEFKLTTATEGARISRLQLIQGGTVVSAGIRNLRVEVNGVKVADGVMTSDSYAVFDFGANPYFIAKGDNRIFKVYGDVAGKKSETVILYFEVTADSLALGDQFGFGMSVTNNMGTTGTAATLTLQGGILTLSFVGPSATNISTTTTKTHLLDFDLNSAANIEMRKHTIVLCKDTDGNGTFDAASDTTNGWGDINNVSIIDRDTGVSLVGPQDGSAFTTSNTSCPGTIAGAAKQFTDVFNINAGETKHLAVVGDIKTSNTGGVQLVSTDAIRAIIDGYGDAVTTSGDLTILKYAGTNTAVTSTDVVPSGDVSGNSMTIQGSSLTLALASVPTGNNNYVKGTKNVNSVGFNFSTALGNPVTVTNVTLTGYVADSGTTLVKGVASAPDANLNVGLLAAHVRLVDAATGAVLASDPATNNLSVSTGTAQYNNLNWAIPGGSTKTLLVQTDLSSNATSGSSDVFSFDIAATTDVTAIDQNSNSINAANSAINGTTAPTTYTTVNSVGTLTPALAADSPTSAAVYWGQTDAAFSKFKFTSKNEGFYLERLNLYTADTSADLTNNVKMVKVSYTSKDGSTLTSSGTFNSAASISFAWNAPASGQDPRPYVPKDGVMVVTVTGNLNSATDLFRATNKNFSIDFSGGVADEFRAVGEGSGTVIDGATSTIDNVAANNQYAYRSFPLFTYISTPATTIAVGQDVLRFKVDAMGVASDGATVFFDGATATASGSLKFAVTASAQATNTLGFDLRRVVDSSGAAVDQLVATRSLSNIVGGSAPIASSASLRFQDVAANKSVEIPAGSSNTFVLRLNTVTSFANTGNTSGRGADYMQVFLRNNEASLIQWTDKGGTDRNASVPSTANILKNLPINGSRVLAK